MTPHKPKGAAVPGPLSGARAGDGLRTPGAIQPHHPGADVGRVRHPRDATADYGARTSARAGDPVGSGQPAHNRPRIAKDSRAAAHDNRCCYPDKTEPAQARFCFPPVAEVQGGGLCGTRNIDQRFSGGSASFFRAPRAGAEGPLTGGSGPAQRAQPGRVQGSLSPDQPRPSRTHAAGRPSLEGYGPGSRRQQALPNANARFRPMPDAPRLCRFRPPYDGSRSRPCLTEFLNSLRPPRLDQKDRSFDYCFVGRPVSPPFSRSPRWVPVAAK